MKSFDPVPETLVATRTALHRLAAYVIAPARHRAVERFGLHATEGGFGTPEFNGRTIRVDGTQLIDEQDGEVRRTTITSLDAAVEFLGSEIDTDRGAEPDTPPVGDVTADLEIDETASRWLGNWFAATFAALQEVRTDDLACDPSEVFLWPGHFDPGMETGDDAFRASYGASPGDSANPEPYLYVSVWWPDRLALNKSDPVWNADSFVGTKLSVSDFPEGADPMHTAMAFWREGRTMLDGLEELKKD